ncbi:MAG: S-adenosyl-l-methionine hydroxide adenosyltransferase family protein [Armatimonadota bacterium]|nr:S-adenosyl-l-methionine hydroxide adenosyltransferase family protein [Armatimonadota bacterium]
MAIITFLSDFGSRSPYPAAMKAVASAICQATFLDISHDVRRHDVREGAYLLFAVVPYFPVGTVHVAVVDPGVGTARAGLIVTAGGQFFVGPDNGLLLPAAHRLGKITVYRIQNPAYFHSHVSPTFHGRDIFAPVGAHLARGVPPGEIGERVEEYVDLDFGRGVWEDGSFLGKVVYIDPFGNLVTNIPGEMVQGVWNHGDLIVVESRKWSIEVTFTPSYGFVPPGQFLAAIGSDGFLEIAINQGDAARELGAAVDQEIRVKGIRADRETLSR